jgi:hypothetical protein
MSLKQRTINPMQYSPPMVIISRGRSHKPDSTVFVQFSSVLETPWGIKVSKNSRSTNQPYARKLSPVLDDWIFAGQIPVERNL